MEGLAAKFSKELLLASFVTQLTSAELKGPSGIVFMQSGLLDGLYKCR